MIADRTVAPTHVSVTIPAHHFATFAHEVDFQELYAVERMSGGEITIRGDRDTLRSTIIGCVLASSHAVAAAAECWSPLGATRSAIAELEFWLARLEEIGEEEDD